MTETTRSQTRWTVEELSIALHAYLARLHGDDTRPRMETILETAERIGRSRGSVEYRWQNFSAILVERGEDWLTGFAPLHNVGAVVRPVVNALLDGVVIEDDALPSTAMDRRVSVWVYLVEHPIRQLFKLGITVDPDHRIGSHLENGYVDRGHWYVGLRARSVEQTVIAGWRSAGLEPVESAPEDGHTETVSTTAVSLEDIYMEVATAIAR